MIGARDRDVDRPLVDPHQMPLDLDGARGVDPAVSMSIRAAIVRRVQAMAVELLERAGTHGVGFDEVRLACETRGILTGAEAGAFLSFGSAIMRKAGGIPVGSCRSKNRQAARRRIRVYVLAKYLGEEQWTDAG